MCEQIEKGVRFQSVKAAVDNWNVRHVLPLLLLFKLTANQLTIARLVLGPSVATLLLFGQASLAMVLFILAAMTDYYDGLLARVTGSVSAWGKRWDERADKVLIASVVLAKVVLDYQVYGANAETYVLLDLLSVTILRDAIVLWARNNDLASPEVLWSAKVKTAMQMIAVGSFIFGAYNQEIMYFGYVLFFIATMLSLYSGWVYIKPLREQCGRLVQ